MAEQQRKIELQSPDDLQYLVANVKRAAREMIDRDLPPIEGEDAMRRLVEEIVGEYIQKTFLSASPSISINGMSPPHKLLDSHLHSDINEDIIEEREEHEPFDGQLWEKAKALAIREEELVEQIAALRRNVPGTVVKRENAWRKAVEEEEGVIEGRLGG
ncbi:21cb7979-2a6c-4235-a7b6-4a47cc493b45 [Sclerotinia trifoliorum]|uniref:21cb7979-2a6c-4235-a7b6-4a47cc493b45 n=1 Tax=Sclerotinia trifoliorum TaxID=28548 RepID=A0A8H2W6M9_9HELO|nr:21cb7979-2a6c-4235-a7b6-4a47cc493b45 [Sclerotinia trifoliorum]